MKYFHMEHYVFYRYRTMDLQLVQQALYHLSCNDMISTYVNDLYIILSQQEYFQKTSLKLCFFSIRLL